MSGKTIGALLLAGGHSTRMGQPKDSLAFQNTDFLHRIAGELGSYPERLLSTGDRELLPPDGFHPVPDWVKRCGPLGGLCAGLAASRSDCLLVVACDMPLFSKELGDYIAAFVQGDADAYLCMDRQGRVHPLCGIYARSALPVLERQLERGCYRLMDAVSQLRVVYVPLKHSVYPDEVLCNINMPEDYRSLRQNHGTAPPMLAVCGVKNSGKTTFLCHLLPCLRHRGLRVAVIKHDGHDFTPDRPGTDSFQLRQAGAEGTAVYSAARYQVVRDRAGMDPAQLSGFFEDVDLILLEGGKETDYPKLELLRRGVSEGLASRNGELLAVCTDLPDTFAPTQLALDDYEGAADLICTWLQKQDQ